MSTRRAWRPPSNGVARERVEDLLGEADAGDRAPIATTLASLWLVPACRVQTVAQRGPHAAHLVGGELLTLAAATDDDADLGVAVAA